MRKRVVYTRKGPVYYIGDKVVSKAEFDGSIRMQPLKVGKAAVEHHTTGYQGYPIKSVGLAVHPDQVKEAQEHSKKLGVPTEFTKDGRAILRDASHRKAYLKAYNMMDRNSFTGY